MDYTRIISFQGVIYDSNGEEIPDEDYDIEFTLYDGEEATSSLWSETQNITILNSYIFAYLGKIVPLNLDFNSHYWLGISINSEELSRIPLTASPYSIGNIKSINTMTGSIIISGSNGVDVTSNQGNIDIRLTNPGIINNTQASINEIINDLQKQINDLKIELKMFINKNTQLDRKVESLERELQHNNKK